MNVEPFAPLFMYHLTLKTQTLSKRASYFFYGKSNVCQFSSGRKDFLFPHLLLLLPTEMAIANHYFQGTGH